MKPRVYVDSAIWIARFEGQPSYKQIINGLLQTFDTKRWTVCISDAVLLEVLCKPYQENRADTVAAYQQVFRQTRLLPDYRGVFKDALTIAAKEKLRAIDAVHVAFASHYHCERFITTDAHFKNLATLPALLIDLSPSS